MRHRGLGVNVGDGGDVAAAHTDADADAVAPLMSSEAPTWLWHLRDSGMDRGKREK